MAAGVMDPVSLMLCVQVATIQQCPFVLLKEPARPIKSFIKSASWSAEGAAVRQLRPDAVEVATVQMDNGNQVKTLVGI